MIALLRQVLERLSSMVMHPGRGGSGMSALHLPARRFVNVTDIDLKMMRRAIELGELAAASDEVPVGAVIYRGDTIIAEAANNREATGDPVGHAELLAISEAGKKLSEWRLSDCTLAVTLEPCPMCAGALVNARVGRLIYGTTDPKAGACNTLYRIPTDARLNHKVEVIGGVMADECAKLLKDFFKRRRNENKQAKATR